LNLDQRLKLIELAAARVGEMLMVKQFLAMIALSLLAACANPIAHRTPTMTATWDTTARHDTTVKQLGGKP